MGQRLGVCHHRRRRRHHHHLPCRHPHPQFLCLSHFSNLAWLNHSTDSVQFSACSMPVKSCCRACVKLMIITSGGPIMLPGNHTRFSQSFSLFHFLLGDYFMTSISLYVHYLLPTFYFELMAFFLFWKRNKRKAAFTSLHHIPNHYMEQYPYIFSCSCFCEKD